MHAKTALDARFLDLVTKTSYDLLVSQRSDFSYKMVESCSATHTCSNAKSRSKQVSHLSSKHASSPLPSPATAMYAECSVGSKLVGMVNAIAELGMSAQASSKGRKALDCPDYYSFRGALEEVPSEAYILCCYSGE